MRVCVRQMKFPVTHSTTLVWNGLFEQAMTDGASYFLTCHDDTEFYPMTGKYWSDVLVGASGQHMPPHLTLRRSTLWDSQSDPHCTLHLCKGRCSAVAENAIVSTRLSMGLSAAIGSITNMCVVVNSEASVVGHEFGCCREPARELHPPAAGIRTMPQTRCYTLTSIQWSGGSTHAVMTHP
jgi:hypothetical protein